MNAIDAQHARDYAALEDAELVALVRGGDREAFRHVMRRCNQRLYRVVRGVVEDDAEAEDVVQEAYVHAFEKIDGFRGEPQRLGLPSAPERPLLYLEQPNRPQPRFDAGRGRGMTVSMGRLRPCSVLDWKFVTLGHNTVRGAAGASVLNAELMYSEGLLD